MEDVNVINKTINHDTEYLTPRAIRKNLEIRCQCQERPPQRPPKPNRLPKKPPIPLPLPSKDCSCKVSVETSQLDNSKVGPYENYDVPKISHREVMFLI